MTKVLSRDTYKGQVIELCRGECRQLDADGNVVRFARVMTPDHRGFTNISSAKVYRTKREAKEAIDFEGDLRLR